MSDECMDCIRIIVPNKDEAIRVESGKFTLKEGKLSFAVDGKAGYMHKECWDGIIP